MLRPPLSKDIAERIDAMCSVGRKAWLDGNFEEAEKQFLSAWNELPEPKFAHDFYPEILSRGLTTFYRDTKQFPKAYQWFEAMQLAYAPSEADPFLLATVHFEANRLDEAFAVFESLVKKHKMRPFQGTDRKYLDFYKSRAAKR